MQAKHLLVFFGFVLAITTGARTQDLKGDWEKIQAQFLSGMHDSVIVNMPPFLRELDGQNLHAQLSVAYFHYAVSLAQIGNDLASDSSFGKAKAAAQQAGLPEQIREIESKQIQLYLGLARQNEQLKQRSAAAYYGKALALLGNTGDDRTRAVILYQRGVLRNSVGEMGDAVSDLEAAYRIAEKLPNETTMQSSLISLLNELYLKTGQSEKARRLAERSGSVTGRIEYSIKLAAEAESGGEFERADALLASVQRDLMKGGEEGRIIDFVKKRYSLVEAMGRPDQAYDTLRSMLAAATESTPGVRFQIARFAALLAVQSGNIQEAGEYVSGMRSLLPSGASNRLTPLLEQTEGDVAYLRGDNSSAISHYRKALSQEQAFDESSRLSIMNNLGLALTRNGEHEEALSVYARMYALSTPIHLRSFRIQSDLNSGVVLVKTDRIPEASERFQRAQKLAGETGDVTLKVMASLRLAESYRRSGYEKSAETLFDEVRQEQDGIRNPFSRIQVLQALATQAKISGNKFTALLNLRQAYQLAEQVGATGYLAPLMSDLGDTYFLVDSVDAARRMYESALRSYEQTQDLRAVIELRYKVGQCFLATSRFEEARREVKLGMQPLEESLLTDPDLLGQGLASLAFIDFTEGRRRSDIRKSLRAFEEIDQAVRVLELRKGLGVSGRAESRSAANVNAYRLAVDIGAGLYEKTRDPKYFESAFTMSERSRAEDFVTEVGSQLVTKMNDPKLRDLAVAASQLLAEAESRQSALRLDLNAAAAQTRGMTLSRSESDTDDKTVQRYDAIVSKLSAENDKAAQLVTVNTLNLSSVRTLMRSEDVVLNYYVSIEKVYLFLVTKTTESIRTIHWMPEDLGATVEAYRSAIHDLKKTDYRLFARQLYDSLIAPVAAEIAGKHLVIIPSGRLNNLPFGGLMQGEQYLAERHDITVLPNASTLQFVQTGKRMPSSPSILAIGNPANPRVTRLPGTEKEVNQIHKIYPRSLIYLGEQATESNAKQQMGGFDIVHLACHGLFNYDYPYLSSLALSPDRTNDGFLEVHELYNLNLTTTNLVLLSACETGLSKIKKNDDVIGLVRGFLYAGVPSTIASLWKVDDFATEALMSQFHLLLKLGNSKSEALRKAQLQLLRQDATRHPFYWAAFVLYGSDS